MRDVIHDCYYNVFGSVPTENMITVMIAQLPQDIVHESNRRGANDTVVRDSMYLFIKNTYRRREHD